MKVTPIKVSLSKSAGICYVAVRTKPRHGYGRSLGQMRVGPGQGAGAALALLLDEIAKRDTVKEGE